MNVRDLEVVPVAHRSPPLRTSWGSYPEHAARTVVRLTTADGEVGVGETFGSQTVIDRLEGASQLVKGMNPYERTPLKLRLQHAGAYAGLEMALLDLVGKSVGAPVAELLGGRLREEVEFSGYLFYKYADPDPTPPSVTPGTVDSPETMVEEAREFVDRYGFEALKLKGGVLPPEEEVATLRALADEFGPDVPLRIDPNGNWSVETATRVASELCNTDATVQFLEDPCATMHAHARLKRVIDYPVATNMYVTSFEEVAPAVKMDAVDVILSDYHYWEGLSGGMRLDTLARTFDLGTTIHSTPHLGIGLAGMIHLGAATRTIRYANDTHYPWTTEDVIENPFEFHDGAIAVPDRPGLGVTIDEEALSRLNERYERTEPLAFSGISSLGAKLSDEESEARRAETVPDKPRW